MRGQKIRRHRQDTILDADAITVVRGLANQAFSRAAGAPVVGHNRVLLLENAAENYPAWLQAIRSARSRVHLESYIIRSDATGEEFAEALSAKAREGVAVRVLYDWLGALGKTSRGFWRKLRAAGVEVRTSNPPSLGSPFGWLSRDHRKMLAVDGEVAFVTGLCIGHEWVGDPERGVDPWRDTGIEIRGPAVADVERAFAQMWAAAGEPLPPRDLPGAGDVPPAGSIGLRVVATTPALASLYRLDLLISALARERLWLTDAYFAGVPTYVQALGAAARDGVDVRLLVPGGSDIPVVRLISQASYRPLLEAGVRVFEWNGPMLHCKSAVADTRWARIGSTNLNLASWLGNWELDVVIEDPGFARELETSYERDLESATEVVLSGAPRSSPVRIRWRGRGKASRAAVGALRFGNLVGASLVRRRVLETTPRRILLPAGLGLLALALVAVFWPWAIAVPFALLAGWVALAMIGGALRRQG